MAKFARGRDFPDMHQPERKFCIEGWIEEVTQSGGSHAFPQRKAIPRGRTQSVSERLMT